MILAIDPGLITGWATWNSVAKDGFDSGMVEGRFKFYQWFYGLMSAAYGNSTSFQNRYYPSAIVMEKFTITLATAKKSPQLDPLYIIGHIEAIAERDGITFATQTPAQAMSFATNEKLKAVGWYKPGAGHDNDAARHLMLWLIKHPPAKSDLLQELADKLGLTLSAVPGTPPSGSAILLPR